MYLKIETFLDQSVFAFFYFSMATQHILRIMKGNAESPCMFQFFLCCPVQVEALRWDNSPSLPIQEALPLIHKTPMYLMAFTFGSRTSTKMTVFWAVAQCSLVEFDRRAYCLHHQATSQKTVMFILAAVRT
jgi:hypothetical protein